MNPVSSETFRHLCGHFATGVTIVTAFDGDGASAGMTANSFASVSLDPPLVSVAVDHDATVYPALMAADRFAINILEAKQEVLSRRFADSLAERFEGIGWRRDGDGFLILDDTLAHLRCEKVNEIVAGDHTIFIGRVVGGEASGHGRPLLHYRGGYAGFEGT